MTSKQLENAVGEEVIPPLNNDGEGREGEQKGPAAYFLSSAHQQTSF